MTLKLQGGGTVLLEGETVSRELAAVAAAWVDYDHTTPSISDSFNVSSVTDNGTGDCEINLSNSMNAANYATPSYIHNVGGNFHTASGAGALASDRTTALWRITNSNHANSQIDSESVASTMFGDLA